MIHPKLIHAKYSDLDAICELHKQELSHLKWAYNKKYMTTVLNDETSRMYCLKLDELIIGCVQWYYEKDHVLINTIAINKGFQGLGYGENIFKYVEKYNQPWAGRITKVKFWTKKNQVDSHIKWYKSLGYEIYENDGKWLGFKKEIN